ncbi:putative reverse transcriptase domain-containing protein [Tanacetum coccineum]
MRPSHHLCSLVLSIHRSSAAIFERPSHDSSSASPSRKRSRSPAAFVPLSSPIPRTLSFARADLLPSPKRIMSHESATDLEVSSAKGSEPSRYRGTDLDDVERSDGIDIDPEIQAEIDKCIAYADALRVREIDARFVVEEEGAVEVTYKTLRDLVQRFHDHTRQSLADMMDVASQRVTRSQRRELRVQREMRQIQHFRFYIALGRVARLKLVPGGNLGLTVLRALFIDYPSVDLIVIMTIPNSRSGASRTCEGFNEQIDRQLAGALRAGVAARNLEPLIGGGGEQEEISRNGGSRNGGNGNRGNENGGNGNGGGNGYNFEGFMPTRETIGIEATYAMSWAELMKLMTEVYCLRNEIQKMETELWNLAVKGNDLTAYTRRFQELVLLCTGIGPSERDQVESLLEMAESAISCVLIGEVFGAKSVSNEFVLQQLKSRDGKLPESSLSDLPESEIINVLIGEASCDKFVPAYCNGQSSKLYYSDPKDYPSSCMTQLLQVAVPDQPSTQMVVDYSMDLNLPNFNESFTESQVNDNAGFDFENIENHSLNDMSRGAKVSGFGIELNEVNVVNENEPPSAVKVVGQLLRKTYKGKALVEPYTVQPPTTTSVHLGKAIRKRKKKAAKRLQSRKTRILFDADGDDDHVVMFISLEDWVKRVENKAKTMTFGYD